MFINSIDNVVIHFSSVIHDPFPRNVKVGGYKVANNTHNRNKIYRADRISLSDDKV